MQRLVPPYAFGPCFMTPRRLRAAVPHIVRAYKHGDFAHIALLGLQFINTFSSFTFFLSQLVNLCSALCASTLFITKTEQYNTVPILFFINHYYNGLPQACYFRHSGCQRPCRSYR